MIPCEYFCSSSDHAFSRRSFLGGVAGTGALGFSGFAGFTNPLAAKELESKQKRVVVIFLSGGVSQLESWDPKPNTDTGGPFRAIPTSTPGIHISELLPYTAKQMHHLALVRSINTGENEHSRGRNFMLTGRRMEAAIVYPEIGAVVSRLLGTNDAELPGHIHITPKGSGGFNAADAAFLGPQYASVQLGNGKPPPDLLRPATLKPTVDQQREALRVKLNERFAKSRRSAQTDAYASSFDQAAKVVSRAEVFDVSKESAREQDRYGRHDFGRHLLLARRLLENGVTFVKVSHTNYDTHHENFDFHIEQLGEFDRPFATFLEDLSDRGMLQSTLVVVMSEFGRTPRINDRYGRDHWGNAWSVALGGCGIQGGAVVGRTNANGTAVADRQVSAGHLFHTYLQAVGLNPERNFYPDHRPVPIGDPKASAITEILT